MNCPNCGKPLPEGALFCVACGARVPVEPVAAPQAAPQTPPVQPQYAPQQPYAQQPYAQQYPPQYAPQYQNYQPAPPAQPSAFSKWMKREGLVYGMPEAEYHGGRDELSSTGAKLLLDCPAKFKHEVRLSLETL